MYTPVNSNFTIYEKWGFRGSKLYRRVFVMLCSCAGGSYVADVLTMFLLFLLCQSFTNVS